MDVDQLNKIISIANAEGWTQSEITTMDDCSLMWFWRYGLKLQRKGGLSWASLYGTAFHDTLDRSYKTGGVDRRPAILDIPENTPLTGVQLEDREYWQRLLNVQTTRYIEHYIDDFVDWEIRTTEQDVDVMFEGIRFRGKIDLTFFSKTGRLWLLDHKTTNRMDKETIDGWSFRFQFMFYLWLAMKANPDLKFSGYYINAVKKPTIRQKKTESADSFYARLDMEMAMEPEKYYYREPLILTENSIKYFEEVTLRPKINRIKLLTNSETPAIVKEALAMNPNTNRCHRYGTCEFFRLCQHGMDAEQGNYIQRATKHEELNGDGASTE